MTFPLRSYLPLGNNAASVAQMIELLGLDPRKVNYDRLKEVCRENFVDISDLVLNGKANARKISSKPWQEWLVISSTVSRSFIKEKLIKSGLLGECCAVCGLGPIWNCKKLTFVLDHENGINDDYSLENLRLLCPNCNSQTATFSGKNTKRIKKIFACLCGVQISRGAAKCKKCSVGTRQRINGAFISITS